MGSEEGVRSQQSIALNNPGSLPDSGGALLATPRESQATPLQLFVESYLFQQNQQSTLNLTGNAGYAEGLSQEHKRKEIVNIRTEICLQNDVPHSFQ
jgi:hypothetical protein